MNDAPVRRGNLVLVGPMGAGKTSIGRRLAAALDLRFEDADQALEAQTGASVGLIFEIEGEPGFRRREQDILRELCGRDRQVIATGGGAVLDPGNRALLRGAGFVVWLQASVEQQLARLERDRTRPLLQAADRLQRLQAMAEQRNPIYRQLADLRFDSDGLAVDAAAARLLALLREHWAPARVGDVA